MKIKLTKGNLTTYMNDDTDRWPQLKQMLLMGWQIVADNPFAMQAG